MDEEVKVSELAEASVINDEDLLMTIQQGTNKKASFDKIKTRINQQIELAEYGNSTIDPNTTLYPLILSRHTNTPEGSSGVFYYIKTIFFQEIDTSKSRTQIAIGYNVNKIWQRYYSSGTWSAWVLVSPSKITTGTEYATGEFIDGKQVYRKRISLGSFTNNTNKTVVHYISNPTFIRISIMGTNGNGTYQDMALRAPFECYATGTAVVFNPGGDYSAWTGYADLWYTKG